MTKTSNGNLGIVVGGGPAPGINGVISSVTIEAINRGCAVLGLMDGFKRLVSGQTRGAAVNLVIDDVSRIHLSGGSILRTSRVNPAQNPESLRAVLAGLKKLKINRLVTIGGEGTAGAAHTLYRSAANDFQIAHVPKTIDNDLPLPGNRPAFGYETARHVGTNILANLIEDAKTTRRWFFVVAMGRLAGHLTLGMAKSAGATLAVIPEELRPDSPLQRVCDILEGAIIKRLAMGKDYGVAVIAEGVASRIKPGDIKVIEELQSDEYGHLRLADLGFAEYLKRRVEHSLRSRGVKISITDKNIGYELRCAAPIPYDTEYARDLGYAAVKYLFSGDSGAVINLVHGKATPIPLKRIMNPATGRTRLRLVDLRSDSYEVALSYMIRLDPEDFKDEASINRLARASRMSADEFKKRFQYAIIN
ncbi:MAG: 6-phosphofructokinase [Elusimicrobia bacterium]|nr:6-phosphofructokinase [Elusimicrobiota bacterium]